MRQFVTEVQNGTFPGPEHNTEMSRDADGGLTA